VNPAARRERAARQEIEHLQAQGVLPGPVSAVAGTPEAPEQFEATSTKGGITLSKKGGRTLEQRAQDAIKNVEYSDLVKNEVFAWNPKKKLLTPKKVGDAVSKAKKQMLVVGHVRVSTQSQIDGAGLESQLQLMHDCATEKWGKCGDKWQFLHVFVEAPVLSLELPSEGQLGWPEPSCPPRGSWALPRFVWG
jgi:hypothetical protein